MRTEFLLMAAMAIAALAAPAPAPAPTPAPRLEDALIDRRAVESPHTEKTETCLECPKGATAKQCCKAKRALVHEATALT